ncbi:pyrroloquinoline quinone biosynthesis peptide chaperone PqqD [Hydrocarboniphaga sp.]|uniref:pyrroloquinoline quinone biosynthesis peptide chaperone PqqD n=1 Tax=Hydrocarboniphaga sp. TaxID=2033016 RepID=UPI003D0C1729
MNALQSRPRIARGLRLQWEPAQNAHVLLYPEGMVQLNASAGEILKRCDGERDLAAIVDDLQQAFEVEDLRADVLAFIELASAQRWIESA